MQRLRRYRNVSFAPATSNTVNYPRLLPTETNTRSKPTSCFNNCPNDPRRHDYDGQQQIFCAYATQFPMSSPTSKAAKPTPSASATQTNDGSGSGAAKSTGSGTATGTGAQATKTNNAADLAFNAGGILAAVAGVVAAVL